MNYFRNYNLPAVGKLIHEIEWDRNLKGAVVVVVERVFEAAERECEKGVVEEAFGEAEEVDRVLVEVVMGKRSSNALLWDYNPNLGVSVALLQIQKKQRAAAVETQCRKNKGQACAKV